MASSPARVGSDQVPALVPVALPVDLPAHLAAGLVADLGAGDTGSTSSLAVALAAVPDARCRRGRRHELTGVLTIAACACLTGATSYVAISEWAAARGAAVLDCLGDQRSTGAALPCEATLRRCLQPPGSAGLAAALPGWARAHLPSQQAPAAGGSRREPVAVGTDRRVI